LDAIGDYILLRNFIRLIKDSAKFKDYKITLCGNIIWKELAETLDSDCIDKFIWIDRTKLKNNIFYKFRLLKMIKLIGFETAIDLTYSREILFGDSIIKASNAIERIGSEGSPDSYVRWKRKLFSDNYYTRLLTASSKNLFEFFRNKEFFERLLETNLEIQKPTIDVSKISSPIDLMNDYAVIFPGASEPEKTWDVKNFTEIAKYLESENSLKIVVAGSSNESKLGKQIVSALGNTSLDLTGKTSLSQLAKIISSAKILISNDTSAVHFAAAVNTTFICVSNGSRFGRFHPYPAEVFNKGHYVYPTEIINQFYNIEILNEKFRFSSDLDINSIKPEVVINLIRKVLK
jgi:ADP-heptose:LPS heptosyltransferase